MNTTVKIISLQIFEKPNYCHYLVPVSVICTALQLELYQICTEAHSDCFHLLHVVISEAILFFIAAHKYLTNCTPWMWSWLNLSGRAQFTPSTAFHKQLHFYNPSPRFVYLLCNFCGFTMKVIQVICQNNARPSFKCRVRFCVCAKSRGVLKVPLQSFSATSIYRIGLQKLSILVALTVWRSPIFTKFDKMWLMALYTDYNGN